MNLHELDNYNLKDAVRFHNRLNPRLWGSDEHLLPEVKTALMRIAEDFKEFLGISDLAIKDITISGSNAAYNYTPHSDIDLHLVVDIPEINDEVYRELFNAKKYQYNDEHDIKVRDADVELYVQPSTDTAVSQGVYSLLNNNWVQVPKRKRAKIDDASVRNKYDDLKSRIEKAVSSNNTESIANLIAKIKKMRQTSLNQHGEFGAENLAYKILRTQGLIQKLYDARSRSRDLELSLKERERIKERVRYGYSVDEASLSTPDGVSASTCMFTDSVEPPKQDILDIVRDFFNFCCDQLDIKTAPSLRVHRDPAWSERNQSFGRYDPDQHHMNLAISKRHVMDMLRTLAHELVHARQHELSKVPNGAGDTGSKWENQANALAGQLMRVYGRKHPELFNHGIAEGASGYIPSAAEKNDPRFKTALTVDIKPGTMQKNAAKLGSKIARDGTPPLLMKKLGNLLESIKNEQDQSSSWGQLAEEDELFELKMSPSNLARMAKDIDARAGLEFELVVPDIEGEQEELDPEPDYDVDERFPTGPGWRREVINFFRGGDSPNSTGYIERQLNQFDENFYGWLEDELENYLDSAEGRERAIEIARENVDAEEYEQDPEGAMQRYLDDNQDSIREQIEEEFRDDTDSHFERYLEEEDLTTMSEFGSAYNLDWPYWTYPEPDQGSADIDAVAESFSDAIGRPVTVSKSYHGATRRAGHYAVEPDSSIEGDDGEGGLEFVSPPLPIPEMIEDISKVAKWASRIGAYTNSSTGLHMNVSVPNIEDLDYVKLVMFLGDNYILEQFGRDGNIYCKSALEKIKSTARANPDRVDEMLRQFQGGLNQLASKLIHTGSTEKYTSINRQSNRVEFRSPGGDWLSEYESDPGKVTNTLLRTVVALDVASDPEAFKKEYYKKLYKTLSQGSEDTSIEYFAKYAAGELPKQALKSFIRQIQTKREVKKQAPGSGKQYWWRVSRAGYSGSIEVVAATREEAIDKGTSSPDGYPSWRSQPDVRAEPLRPYEETPQQTSSRDQEFTGTWEVVSRNTDEVVYTFGGIGNEVAVAQRRAENWAEATGFDDPIYVRPVMRSRQQQPQAGGEQSTDANYEIVDKSTQPWTVKFRFIANTPQEAIAKLNDWIRGTGEYRAGDTSALSRYAIRPIAGRPTSDPVGRDAAQGGLIDLASEPAQGTGSLPEGNVRWRILDFDNNEVHSFLHRANQREANAYALQWLRQNGMLGRGEFMVVPTT
jgi:hypothetical protein